MKKNSLKNKPIEVGSYVYLKIGDKYSIGKVTIINDMHVWGTWSSKLIDELPKTIEEFETIPKIYGLFANRTSVNQLDLIYKNELTHIVKGQSTIVLVKDEKGKVISRGRAKCMEEDTFSEAVGLAMAYSRAKGKEFVIPRKLDEYTDAELLQELYMRTKKRELAEAG